MSNKQKTKQGMASIYVVVFVTMLIGVITLSFLRIMLSETGRTKNSTLADSAMDSALAGVEDAKALLTRYTACQSSGGSDCGAINDLVNKATGEDGKCDLGTDSESESAIGVSDEFSTINDQAYTCVNISLEGNFEGNIDSDHPVLVVPMRTKKEDDFNRLNKVHISWRSGSTEGNVQDDFENGTVNKSSVDSVLGKKAVKDDTNVGKQNGIKVTLIQTSTNYNIGDFYAAEGDTTNRSTLMILPKAGDGASEYGFQAFIDASDKTYNAPITARCGSTGENCSVTLTLPEPKGGARDPNTAFLLISGVYVEPSMKVEVTMLDASKNVINFYGVQPIIDATGRAGDMLRRVEVRLGPDYSLVPYAELAVEDGIDKSFYVTKNCIKGVGACTE